MNRLLLRRVLRLMVGVLIVGAVLRATGGQLLSWATHAATPVSRGILIPTRHIAGIVRAFTHAVSMAEENELLRAQLAAALHEGALGANEQEELAFYRASLGLQSITSGRTVTMARVFATPALAGVRMVSIDRGGSDGVVPGDVVVTASGSFVGIVGSIEPHRALVRALGDPALQIAARISGTAVTGLVHRADEGLVFDLVRNDETVTEGSGIVTTGDDRLPPGLVLGVVRSIDHTATTLFQLIRVAPVNAELSSGWVLVIHP